MDNFKQISIFSKFKKWIIAFIIGIGVCAAGSAIIPEKSIDNQINAEVKKIEAMINSDRQANGKYKRQDKKNIDGVSYEVHEYETPTGEIGYTIFITKEVDGIISTKAISTGVEKASRESNWKIIKDNNIYEATTTATTTIE